jgi:hypothetical protein
MTERGVLLEERTVRLRCPMVTPAVAEVDRTALPREVPVKLSNFADELPYDVELDGTHASAGTTDPAGEASSVVTLPAFAACGPHDVTVRQVLPPVGTMPPYEEPPVSAPPPPPDGPAPGAEPEPSRR